MSYGYGTKGANRQALLKMKVDRYTPEILDGLEESDVEACVAHETFYGNIKPKK